MTFTRSFELAVVVVALGVALTTVATIVFSPEPTKFFDEKIYTGFLDELAAHPERYNVLTVRDWYANQSDGSRVNVVLMHDSDWRLSHFFYDVEKTRKFKSTYFIRPNVDYWFNVSNTEFLEKIQSEGWEIGYHYDSLTRINFELNNKSNLNYADALILFKGELAEMRSVGFNVSSVASHGNHLREDIVNKWLFDHYNSTMAKLGVNERYNIPYTKYVSDVNMHLSEDPIQALKNAETGQTILFLLHSDWWK